MFEVLALCITLSRQPIIGNTSEDGHPFSFDTTIPQVIDCPPQFSVISLIGSADIKATSIRIKEFSTAPEANPAPAKTADKFHQIADEWSSATRYTSSTEDLTSNPSYQEIIGLGWDVVPLLLKDLQENKRFWFPALYAITKIRPFDPSDAGNGKRMTDAWIKWGKMKRLI